MNSREFGPDKPRFWTQITYDTEAEQAMLSRHFGSFRIRREQMFTMAAVEILTNGLGFGLSAELDMGVLPDGEPVPLMSYSFIEYVMGLDLSATDVLEIGGGQSTRFWAKRARKVDVIDHDVGWLKGDEIDQRPNVSVIEIQADGYVSALSSSTRKYAMVVLDCGANRLECAKAAIHLLADDGMFVLDNSDWYPNTAAVLREQDLIQVDFADFRPKHQYRCTTSIFLRPSFRPKPRSHQLPLPPIGGKDVAPNNAWDVPSR
ncbi:MAG TPA: hypothetical protein VFW35_04385 [Sphingomicrobium sp.]|nr:hypothetical protein [Sphingomicrobium sp.]